MKNFFCPKQNAQVFEILWDFFLFFWGFFSENELSHHTCIPAAPALETEIQLVLYLLNMNCAKPLCILSMEITSFLGM